MTGNVEVVESAGSDGRDRSAARQVDGRTWWWAAAIIAVVALDISGRSVFQSNSRFLLVLVPWFACVVVRTRRNRLWVPRLLMPEILLLVLVAYGLTGSVTGRIVDGTQASSLTVFLALSMGLIHLANGFSISESSASKYLRSLVVVGVAAVMVHALAIAGVLPNPILGNALEGSGIGERLFSHERSFLLVAALVAALVTRRFLVAAVISALGTVIFFAYPAATFVMVVTAVLLGQWWWSERAGHRFRSVVVVVLAALVIANVSVITTSGTTAETPVVGAYFDRVGKSDNSDSRADLWRAAWVEIEQSPWVGHLFTSEFTVEAKLSGRNVERAPHNDFLQVWMGGGLLAFGLLLAWLISAHVMARRAFRRADPVANRSQMRLARVCLACLDGFIATALFNPVSTKLGLLVVASLAFAGLMALARGVGAEAMDVEPVQPR